MCRPTPVMVTSLYEWKTLELDEYPEQTNKLNSKKDVSLSYFSFNQNGIMKLLSCWVIGIEWFNNGKQIWLSLLHAIYERNVVGFSRSIRVYTDILVGRC